MDRGQYVPRVVQIAPEANFSPKVGIEASLVEIGGSHSGVACATSDQDGRDRGWAQFEGPPLRS